MATDLVETTKETRRTLAERTKFQIVGGIQLSSLAELFQFSEYIFQSGMAPTSFKSAQAVLAAFQLGAELGVGPMAALNNVAVINGRSSIWGDLMLAVCRAAPIWNESAFKEWKENESAFCECARKGGNICRQEYSIPDAKRAGLWGKSGPWTTNPTRMLQMRARAFALRDTFPDVLAGVHMREEMEGAQDDIVSGEPAWSPPDGGAFQLPETQNKRIVAKGEATRTKTKPPPPLAQEDKTDQAEQDREQDAHLLEIMRQKAIERIDKLNLEKRSKLFSVMKIKPGPWKSEVSKMSTEDLRSVSDTIISL